MIAFARLALTVAVVLVLHTSLPAQRPEPPVWYAVVDWVPSTLHPDGSFSSTSAPPGTPLFSGAKMTAYFPGWQTLASNEVIYLSSQITEDLPPVGTPFYFTAIHPTMGSYMGMEKVTGTSHEDPAWQPWIASDEPVPYIRAWPLSEYYEAYLLSIERIAIADRPERHTFMVCDIPSLVNTALDGRTIVLKATYLEGNAMTGYCEVTGTYVPAEAWYYPMTWGEIFSPATCSSSVPSGPVEFELSISGYAPVRTRVDVAASSSTAWHPIIYPELSSDAPGGSDLLPDITFPAAFSQEARIKRISGEVDFVMGDLGETLDQNGDGIVDSADLIEVGP